MSVSEFQNKVWELTDTKEYRELLEKFSQNTALYEQKDKNEIASFLFYTLEPLTVEKWQTRDLNGYGTWCNLFYQFSYHIADKKTLTVGERDDCIRNMIYRIQDF